MRGYLFFLILIVQLFTTFVFGQGKKELIEQLMLKTDSLSSRLINYESSLISLSNQTRDQKTIIDSLVKKNIHLEESNRKMDKEITGLKTINNNLFAQYEELKNISKIAVDSLLNIHTSIPPKYFFITYSNATGELKVPKGKTWYLAGCFGSSDLKIETCDLRVTMKKLNENQLSDLNSKVFSSNLFESNVNMFLPEESTFSFLIYDKCQDSNYNDYRKLNSKSVIFNVVEYSNN
jgi:hypothetical protein